MAAHRAGRGHYCSVGHDVCATAVMGGRRLYQCGNAIRVGCDLAFGFQWATELTRDNEVCHVGVATVKARPGARHIKDHKPECGVMFGHLYDGVFI